MMSAAPLIVRRGEFQISRNEVCFLNEHNYTNIISHKNNIVDEALFAIYLLKFQSLLIITNNLHEMWEINHFIKIIIPGCMATVNVSDLHKKCISQIEFTERITVFCVFCF